jgi:ankyrin repeat protein
MRSAGVMLLLLCIATAPAVAATAAPQEDGTTALHWAVHDIDRERVARLIAAGADVNATNDYGVTPLAEAAVAADPQILRALLKAGAQVEARNPEGQTALMVVARTGRVESAELLIRKGADVNAVEQWRGQTALMWAALEGQGAMVRLLARHGAKVDARSFVNDWARQVTAERRGQWRPIGGLTPLLFAARQGELEAVRALLEAGANPNLPDPEGVTPMLMAATNYHFDVVAYLLKHGGDANRWDWRGRTPLYAAVDLNSLPHGGRPELPSLDRVTSLDLIDLLLKAGANPNAQLKLFPDYRHLKDDRGADNVLTIGSTPLLRAAKAFDVPAIKLLLAHGARTDLPTIDGYAPVMLAAGLGDTAADTRGVYDTKDVQRRAIAALRVLLDAGADVNAVNRKGHSALFGAVWWGWDDVVNFLVEAGARPDMADAQGMTPLDAAMGKAPQGKGRGSQGEDPHPSTAVLLKALMARQ